MNNSGGPTKEGGGINCFRTVWECGSCQQKILSFEMFISQLKIVAAGGKKGQKRFSARLLSSSNPASARGRGGGPL